MIFNNILNVRNVTFYLVNKYESSCELSAVEQLACYLATNKWREGKRILIACESNTQAIKIDRALWIQDTNAFVPHNLTGEGPKNGAPIEICWPECHFNTPRDILISLMSSVCEHIVYNFCEVIDFVPCENYLKALARDRYKAYRSFGFKVSTCKSPNS